MNIIAAMASIAAIAGLKTILLFQWSWIVLFEMVVFDVDDNNASFDVNNNASFDIDDNDGA